ncbi:GDNF family receptor alpha-like isoform X3 [Acanthopagrus latus]|uniref:GDNF family receptor alpha-like isoform X3 n=1 Tax=Acanthopagrus latus TaxID=8177 RepID=UPI00187C33BB|nr:GDNF family receptor alpha-like isoform X3 [Acanthopagrus latus]
MLLFNHISLTQNQTQKERLLKKYRLCSCSTCCIRHATSSKCVASCWLWVVCPGLSADTHQRDRSAAGEPQSSTHSSTAAIMQLVRLDAAVMLGVVVPQIISISMLPPPSDCLARVDICMSELCTAEQAFNDGVCRDEGCQIKGLGACNMTIQTALDQLPSLRGCVCTWKEEGLCDSMRMLAEQCRRRPAAQQKRSTAMDWRSSSLIGYVYDGAGSCSDRIAVCLSDAVCNRYLALVLGACNAAKCSHDSCQRLARQFYSSMPHNIAEMLVMCECEASDEDCVGMKTALHTGTCGDELRMCQDTVDHCVKDGDCRDLLKTMVTKCWSSEDAQCADSDLQKDECFTQMDPARILGADSECKTAFLATLGTTLHHPCMCSGVSNDDLLMCNMIHDVLHNRSHFLTSWENSSGPSKPPEMNESEQGHTWIHDYLLYAFAAVLLVVVVVLMPLAVVSKIWILRRRDKTKYHHPQKSNCVVLL